MAGCTPNIEQLEQKQDVEGLVGALDDEEPGLRLGAARALGRIGGPRAVEPLIAALQSQDEGVREAVAGALGAIGDPRAAEPLLAAMECGRVGGASVGLLVEVYRDDPGVLLPLLKRESTVNVYRGLIELGYPGTEAALIQALAAFGTKPMAEVYLNCGNSELEAAASQWAQDHGFYTMAAGVGGGGVQWGSK